MRFLGKILVIAEKPSVASDYAKALNQFNMQNGYYEGDKYIITWALGHIVSRKELYEYDPNLNRAQQNQEHVLNTLPYFPQKHVLKLSLQSEERFKDDKARLAMVKKNNEGINKRAAVIKSLFNRNDIDYIVNGCDAGREGEAIFYQIYEFLGCRFPVKRLWISSNVASDIVEGFKNLKDGSEYFNLKQASYARAEMDWEHGLNLSVLYSSLYGAQLSVGRVQTPVLNMIVEREKEIENFKPEDYYLLDAIFYTLDNFKYKGKLVIDDTLGDFVIDGKVKDVIKMNNIINAVENKQGVVASIEKSKKKESPKLLYSLSELQKDMGKKYKMTAAEVLSTAQSLYEKHKLITYPRTSSQYLNTTMLQDVMGRLDHLPPEYDSIIEYIKKTNSIFKKVFNDAKVEDHYAMIPTVASRTFDLNSLNEKELLLFTAIVKRFISIFMPSYEYESTSIITKVEDFKFKTTGKKVLQLGWKVLYQEDNSLEDSENQEDNQDLTYDFKNNITVLCDSLNKISKKTQPPKRYTDPTLIAAMEVGGVRNMNLAIEDQEKLDILKSKGLGTEATRAPLIETIISRGYVKRVKKVYFEPTKKGLDFIDKVSVEMLKSPEITGEWEYKLKLVEKGELNKESLIQEAREFIQECVTNVKNSYSEGDRISDFESIDAKCPVCGSAILKSPKAYFCANSRDKCKFVVASIICKKKIKDSDVKDICTKGMTKLIKGFVNPNKKDENGKNIKFDAYLKYDKEANKLMFTRTGHIKKETEYKCPHCKRPIMELESGYGCSGYNDGCRFAFFKKIYNTNLTRTDIIDLLEKGETKVFTNLVNPKYPSRTFSAKLVLGAEVPEIVYLNDNNEPDVGKPTSHFCPICKKSMLEFSRYYKCSSCKFVINKTIANTEMTEEIINQICNNKETSQVLDFISAKGKAFRAKLAINKDTKKLEFKLETKVSNYKCPICNSSIDETNSVYKCSNNKCGLVVWKSINSVVLSDDIIKQIFETGSTNGYVDLISSKGKAFKAKLVVNKTTKKLEFVF